MFVQLDISNRSSRNVINQRNLLHENGIKTFSDMDRIRKVALPFLRKMCLVKEAVKQKRRQPSTAGPVQEDSTWTPGLQPCPSPDSSLFSLCQKVGSRGGPSQGGVVPGDSDMMFQVFNIFMARHCYLLQNWEEQQQIYQKLSKFKN